MAVANLGVTAPARTSLIPSGTKGGEGERCVTTASESELDAQNRTVHCEAFSGATFTSTGNPRVEVALGASSSRDCFDEPRGCAGMELRQRRGRCLALLIRQHC